MRHMRHDSTHDDSDDDDLSWAEQAKDEDDDYTIPCPWCKRPIHEDAEQCPYCERYISEEDALPQRKPWWIIVGVLICLYLVYHWMF
jgi:hypothetical protein